MLSSSLAIVFNELSNWEKKRYLKRSFQERVERFSIFSGMPIREMFGEPHDFKRFGDLLVNEKAIEDHRASVLGRIRLFCKEFIDLKYRYFYEIDVFFYEPWLIRGFAENFKWDFERIYLEYASHEDFDEDNEREYFTYHVKYVCSRFKIRAEKLMRILNPNVFDRRISKCLGPDLTYELSLY